MGALVSSGSAVAARVAAVVSRQSAQPSHGIRCEAWTTAHTRHREAGRLQTGEQIQSKRRISRTITHSKKTHKAGWKGNNDYQKTAY